MATSSNGKKLFKSLVINAYKKKHEEQIRQKFAKKGLLSKMFESNRNRTKSLIDILKESDDLNTISTNNQFDKTANTNSNTNTKSDEEFLKKFYNTPKGGPKHSIAVNRAHHLTNFLSNYIINAFESGHFDKPDMSIYHETSKNNDKADRDYLFEITNVELMSDLTALKVYWMASVDENLNKFIENYLSKSLSQQIRSVLTSEKVINYVPKVLFVRDDTNFCMKRLDEHLAKIKLETQSNENYSKENNMSNENATEKEGNENCSNSSNSSAVSKKKEIKNLYGIDFERLTAQIKNSNNLKVNESNTQTIIELNETSKNDDSSLVVASSTSAQFDSTTKFESKLKAFEMNRRLKNMLLNKSAINRITQLEFLEIKDRL
jgi:ribosome-binding factor A